MAYAVHWQINFVALHSNDAYRVEILHDGYDRGIVQLRGAANPFETSEDNSDDAFTPIRKQTGSLRIADNGYDMDGNAFDYTDLLPNDTFDLQVKLWKVGTTDTLRWIGYIRPDSLTSKMYEAVSIREYKLTCPLGTLYEIPVSFSNTASNLGTVKTMGQILYTALNSITGITWSWVYKQNNVYQRKDLLAKVSLINFLTKNEPTHTTPSDVDTFNATWTDDSTSWGSVLEEICKFWGWTLYSRGLSPYIVARNQRDNFAKLAFGALNDTITTDLTDETIVEKSYTGLTFASTNHTECRRLGYKNVKVESDVNEKATVLDPDYEKATMSYWPVDRENPNPNQIIHISNDYLYVLRRLGAQDAQQNLQIQFLDNYQIYENRSLAVSSLTAPFVISRYEGWKNSEFLTATGFRLQKGIVCYAILTPTPTSTVPTFFAKTLEDVCVPFNSVICIQASVSLSFNPDPDYPSAGDSYDSFEGANTAPPARWKKHSDDGPYYWKPELENRTIIAELRIGNLWYNNGTWSSTRSQFELTCREDGSIVDPINTFQAGGFNPEGILFDNHNGSKGYCIYINTGAYNGQGLCGRMKLTILDKFITNTRDQQVSRLYNGVLDELSISIYNQDSKLYPQNKAKHEFKDVASTKFRGDLDVSLKMASGTNNVYGLGQLFNADFSLLNAVTYKNASGNNTTEQPEQRLLARLKNFYQDVSIQNTIEVLDDDTAELPSTVIYDDNGVKFHTQSITHDWRNGTMKLTLINN